MDIENKNKNKIKRKKCVICNKKFISTFKCDKCEQILCITHFSPEQHNCSYDYKKDYKELVKIETNKVEII